jgi:hypothetical protein
MLNVLEIKEELEPRNRRNGKDDALFIAEVNTGCTVTGKVKPASPGSETMACLT